MNAKSLTEAFGSLSREEQARCIADWIHAASVDARGTYIAGTEAIADPVRLRGFNELHHRLSGQLRKILSHDEERYPDEVFIAMVLESMRELHTELLRAEAEKLHTISAAASSRGRRRAV